MNTPKKKRGWKFYTSTSLLLIFSIAAIFLVNLIWFKPFSVRLFYDKIFLELALDNPELVTQLGIPVLYDRTKDQLSDASDEANWEQFNGIKKNLATLKSYDFDSQSPENKLNTQILSYFLESQVEGEPFFYHGYPVNQLFGIQNELPSFMESAHRIEDESDIAAYIKRLSLVEKKFDQVLEGLVIREEKGITPPTFIIDKVLAEMNGFIGRGNDATLEQQTQNVKENILYDNLLRKIAEVPNLDDATKEQYLQQSEDIIRTSVFPAYGKLISHFEDLRAKSTLEAGVWKLPDGDAFYEHMLKQNTTTDLNPQQVHDIGLSEVARIKTEMFSILDGEGYDLAGKELGEVIQELNKEERFLFPNDDNGREMVIAEYNRILDEINATIDEAFDIRPKAGLEVKRVPAFKEEGSPGAYYNQPAMDGSRGGVFYANLRNVRESVKFGMKTLAYHEGVPGHHFQIAIQSELEGMPVFRTLGIFTAYVEGWALYSEQLAWELGFYDNDPFGNLGRLQAEIFRAVRLVVDTGIHYKKWTREEAIDYMVANTGMTTTEVVTEIERYIVMPGQACAYKIGMIKILELREKAKSQLGNKFDLRQFHNVVLKNGAVPLDVLEQIVDGYIAENG
jgi:uncharacterized protein (DUF885 family)